MRAGSVYVHPIAWASIKTPRYTSNRHPNDVVGADVRFVDVKIMYAIFEIQRIRPESLVVDGRCSSRSYEAKRGEYL
jgi:hypothetical protein